MPTLTEEELKRHFDILCTNINNLKQNVEYDSYSDTLKKDTFNTIVNLIIKILEHRTSLEPSYKQLNLG